MIFKRLDMGYYIVIFATHRITVNNGVIINNKSLALSFCFISNKGSFKDSIGMPEHKLSVSKLIPISSVTIFKTSLKLYDLKTSNPFN